MDTQSSETQQNNTTTPNKSNKNLIIIILVICALPLLLCACVFAFALANIITSRSTSNRGVPCIMRDGSDRVKAGNIDEYGECRSLDR